MSDNWIALIPRDPRYVPSTPQRMQARDLFRRLAPKADEITIIVGDDIRFFDCGANLERITCPSCNSDISLEWWQDRMKDDSDNGSFKLQAYPMPCCSATHTLNELKYDWQQAFGRFAIEAMNPDLGELDENRIQEFAELLGTSLRVVYQHI